MNTKYIPPAATLAFGAAFAAAPAFAPEFIGYAAGQLPVAIARHAVQPAGYAFAIWGLIYTWLLASAVVGLLKRADHAAWAPTRPPLMAAAALGTVWLFIAPAAPLLATVVIVAMAALCLTAFLRAGTTGDRWILSAPLAMFAGWLSAASLVSVGIMLGGYGIMPHPAAALVMVAVLVAGALYVQSRKPMMPVYGATVVWAIIAVAVVNRSDYRILALTALTAALIMGAGTIWLRLKSKP